MKRVAMLPTWRPTPGAVATIEDLFIDPGSKDGCALAAFEAHTLVAYWFEKPGGRVYALPSLGAVYVERPEYQGRRSDFARTQDTMALCWDGAAVAYAYAYRNDASIYERTPRQWKGLQAKPQHHARLWKVLSAGERTMLGGDATAHAIDAACTKGALDRWSRPGVSYYPKAFKLHNILDAVAFGCHIYGRLQ